MSKGFKESEAQIIVEKLVEMIHQNRSYLSEIDGLIGDGDHGINMDKGFTIAAKRLEGQQLGLSGSLRVLGDVLIEEIGGSMGPLYGTFFKRMARLSKDKEIIDSFTFQQMLESAVDGLNQIGNAKVGDKTLMDSLIPALEALQKANRENKEFTTALNEMEEAAKKGWESTKDLVAKVGRASRLGERSRGVLDAGATSCYLILKTFSEEIKKLL